MGHLGSIPGFYLGMDVEVAPGILNNSVAAVEERHTYVAHTTQELSQVYPISHLFVVRHVDGPASPLLIDGSTTDGRRQLNASDS